MLLVMFAASCAHTPPRRATHVPIDARPTPPAPGPSATGAREGHAAAPHEAGSVRDLLVDIAADTLAASTTLRHCATRTLLPEQESTITTARELLAGVRDAVAVNDLEHAAALAREAHQLTRSLACGH